MVQPVWPWPYRFLREKKNDVAWILILTRMLYRMASLSALPYLGTSKRSSSDCFNSSSIQSSDEKIEASQFSMVILERKTSAQVGDPGGANIHVVHGSHFWQIGSIASLATETTGGEIVVAFWPKHGLRSDLRVPNFPGGEHAPRDPLTYHTQSKIADSGPAFSCTPSSQSCVQQKFPLTGH